MNKRDLAAILVALAGSVAGGAGIVTALLVPDDPLIVECSESECVMVARPDPSQCPTLLQGGGDRPEPTDAATDELARVLIALRDNNTILMWHTNVAGAGGCEVIIWMTLEQAAAWRSVLTGTEEVDGGPAVDAEIDLEDVVVVLQPSTPRGVVAQRAGGSLPEERTKAFDLATLDAGVP